MGENLGPCVATIGHLYGAYKCKKPGKIVVAGKCYCGVHDPLKRAAKRAETHQRWDNESNRRNAGRDILQQIRVVTETARKAAHQEGSWDAVADAVAELERLEAVLASLP